MSSTYEWVTASLGETTSAGSRHRGRRSSVTVTGDHAFVGRADGSLVAYDHAANETRWSTDPAAEASVVSSAVTDDGILLGERGPDGEVRLHDADTGDVRWRYRTADDVGEPARDTRFYYPFVADVTVGTDPDLLYVAARRYERDEDGDREFTSVVYAFEPDGSVRWRYEADASPISMDYRDERLAVGYNRCPGTHQQGLVVLDAATGEETVTWDPGNDGQRRVGDVSLLAEDIAVASHGDYYGYLLDRDGDVRWRADLATPIDRGDERLYAYPNHVHATAEGVTFLTGNTYPEEGRETDSRHPDEHTLFGYATDGDRQWSAPVGGFVTELGSYGDHVIAPSAQNFRTRDPDTHGLGVFHVGDGSRLRRDTDGIVSAVSVTDDLVAAVEEPVEYHDEGERRGDYRLHLVRIPELTS